MAFKNRIRLALTLSKPQYVETRRVFTKSNGKIQLLSSQTKKVLELETDYFPAKWHERLAIALAHDTINIENRNKLYSVIKDSDYEIGWVEALDYPVAQAKTKVAIADFEAVNSNCQTCDDVCCAVAPDETIASPTYTESASFNFTLTLARAQSLCSGITLEIININELYVLSATLVGDTISFVLKDSFFANPNAQLCQYKSSKDNCFDTGYVYASVVGTEVGCPPITNLILENVTTNEATFSWDRGLPDTGNPDQWELYLGIIGGSPVQTGNTLMGSAVCSGLAAGATYWLQVRSDCGDGEYSAWTSLEITTNDVDESCGLYTLLYRNFNAGAPPSVVVSFTNCLGQPESVPVFNFVGRPICALQTSPGVPSSINLPPYVTFQYVSIC